jgi:hypothetical protein
MTMDKKRKAAINLAIEAAKRPAPENTSPPDRWTQNEDEGHFDHYICTTADGDTYQFGDVREKPGDDATDKDTDNGGAGA